MRAVAESRLGRRLLPRVRVLTSKEKTQYSSLAQYPGITLDDYVL
jgi:hypothetical protein